ncbi:MAG: non-ribosomal peptide synthetase [Pseudobutyrivibrio sp.]|nr:non-ribosomal peptide synthetase [Pseudobutyrivibrio sp.]
MQLEKIIAGKEYKLNKKSVMEQIIDMAKMRKEAVAIYSELGNVTYGQLIEDVKRIVFILEQNGVKSGDYIAVWADRKIGTIEIILAVLYMGACYIPIESSCPAKRAEYMFESTHAKYWITDKEDAEMLSKYPAIKIDFDNLQNVVKTDRQVNSNLDSPAYIIFTSGTTGLPKGVLVTIRQMQNLCEWFKAEHEIGDSSNILLINSMSFDASVKNIFTPLMAGGAIVIGAENLFDTVNILEIAEKYNVTHLNCVPSLFAALVEADSYNRYRVLEKMKYIILGGEKFNKSIVKRLVRGSRFEGKILNVYGPTECTIISSEYEVSLADLEKNCEIPIGKPIFNMYAYILNDNKEFCSEDEEGTLYLGGIGTARYCTENAKDGFEPDILDPERMMYNTKDFVKLDSNGNIVFLGRKDSQIKLRGYRIELNEIENVIKEQSEVSDAVVFVSGVDTDNPFLGAAIITNTDIEAQTLKTNIEAFLPSYMIPEKIMFYDRFPVTVSGKVDISELSLKAEEETQDDHIDETNLNEVSSTLIEIWQQLLNRNNIKVTDRFFDIGGHSLLLFKMMKMIERDLKVNVSITDIMTYNTISLLTDFIMGKTDSSQEIVKEVEQRVNNRNELLRRRRGTEIL